MNQRKSPLQRSRRRPKAVLPKADNAYPDQNYIDSYPKPFSADIKYLVKPGRHIETPEKMQTVLQLELPKLSNAYSLDQISGQVIAKLYWIYGAYTDFCVDVALLKHPDGSLAFVGYPRHKKKLWSNAYFMSNVRTYREAIETAIKFMEDEEWHKKYFVNADIFTRTNF